jgi:hypothetical protein
VLGLVNPAASALVTELIDTDLAADMVGPVPEEKEARRKKWR